MCSLTLELGSLVDAALGTKNIESDNYTVLHAIMHIILHKMNATDLQVEVKDAETSKIVHKLYDSLPEKEPALLLKDYIIKNGEKCRNYCTNVKCKQEESLVSMKRNWKSGNRIGDECDFDDPCEGASMQEQVKQIKKYMCKNLKKTQRFLAKRVDNIECELAIFRTDMRKLRTGDDTICPCGAQADTPFPDLANNKTLASKSSMGGNNVSGMDIDSERKFKILEKNLCELKRELREVVQATKCQEQSRCPPKNKNNCASDPGGKNLIKINVVQNDKCNKDKFEVYVDDQLCRQPSCRGAYSETSISTARTMDEACGLTSDYDGNKSHAKPSCSAPNISKSKCRCTSTSKCDSSKRNSSVGQCRSGEPRLDDGKIECEIEKIWSELNHLKRRLACMNDKISEITHGNHSSKNRTRLNHASDNKRRGSAGGALITDTDTDRNDLYGECFDGDDDDETDDYKAKCHLKTATRKKCPQRPKPQTQGGGCNCRKFKEEDTTNSRRPSKPQNHRDSCAQSQSPGGAARKNNIFQADKLQQNCTCERANPLQPMMAKCPLQIPEPVLLDMDCVDYIVQKCSFKSKPENLPATCCPEDDPKDNERMEKFSKAYCECLRAKKLQNDTQECGLADMCASCKSVRADRRSKESNLNNSNNNCLPEKCRPPKPVNYCKTRCISGRSCSDTEGISDSNNFKNSSSSNKCDTEAYRRTSSFKDMQFIPHCRSGRKSLSRRRDKQTKSSSEGNLTEERHLSVISTSCDEEGIYQITMSTKGIEYIPLVKTGKKSLARTRNGCAKTPSPTSDDGATSTDIIYPVTNTRPTRNRAPNRQREQSEARAVNEICETGSDECLTDKQSSRFLTYCQDYNKNPALREQEDYIPQTNTGKASISRNRATSSTSEGYARNSSDSRANAHGSGARSNSYRNTFQPPRESTSCGEDSERPSCTHNRASGGNNSRTPEDDYDELCEVRMRMNIHVEGSDDDDTDPNCRASKNVTCKVLDGRHPNSTSSYATKDESSAMMVGGGGGAKKQCIELNFSALPQCEQAAKACCNQPCSSSFPDRRALGSANDNKCGCLSANKTAPVCPQTCPTSACAYPTPVCCPPIPCDIYERYKILDQDHEKLKCAHEQLSRTVKMMQCQFTNMKELFKYEIKTKKENIKKQIEAAGCCAEDNVDLEKIDYVDLTDNNMKNIASIKQDIEDLDKAIRSIRLTMEEYSTDLCALRERKLCKCLFEIAKKKIEFDICELQRTLQQMIGENETLGAATALPFLRNSCCIACRGPITMARNDFTVPALPSLPVRVPYSSCKRPCTKRRFCGGSHTVITADQRQMRIVSKYPPDKC